MGLQSTPAYARVLSHPEVILRNVHRGMFGSRSGIMRVGDFAITPTGTTRQFSIAPGRAYIHGRENALQGGYVAVSDVAENQVLPAPSASPRIDTLLLRIYDEQYGTLPTGTSRAQWDIIPGVAAASPTARPDSDFLFGGSQYVPGAWWRVADIRSNAGDTTIPAGQIYPTLDSVRVSGRTFGPTAVNTAGFGGLPSDAVPGDRHFSTVSGWEYFYHPNGRWYPVAGTTLARGFRTTATATTTAEALILRLDSIPVVQGGLYTLHTSPIPLISGTDNNFLGVLVRVNEVASPGAGAPATAGTSPAPSSNLIFKNASFTNQNFGLEVPYVAGVTGLASLGVFGYIVTSGTGWQLVSRVDAWVQANGVDPGNTGLTS